MKPCHPCLAALTLCLASLPLWAQETPVYRDASLPVEKRVADLMDRLTLEEKATVLNHRGKTIERFSIRADQWNQCLNGVKWDRPTTLFPICLAMAATWDEPLVHEVATVLSDEARGIYNGWHLDPKAPGEHKGLIYRAPVINIERNPYWGRNHEAWGEDPFLTGRFAVAYVKGLQGDDSKHLKIAATLKHYAVNNVETDRTKLNATVSERMLREYWLPHFRDAVVEGGACSLMASYNAINGTPNNINRWLLTDVLKNEWKHEGFVVSDLGGVKTMVEGHADKKMDYVEAVAQSVMAGCDFSDKEYETHIPAAVRSGKLTQERLDDAVRRVLTVRFRLGEFDPFESVSYSKISPQVVGSAKHREVARRTAAESIVLLKNSGLLPLDKTKIKTIAVLGPLADRVVLNNYNGTPGKTVSALDGIATMLEARLGKPTTANTKVDREAGFSGGASVKLETDKTGDLIAFQIKIEQAGSYEICLIGKSFPNRGVFQLLVDGKEVENHFDQYAPGDGAYGVKHSLGSHLLSQGIHHFTFKAVGKNPASTGFTGHFDRLDLVGPKNQSFELETVSLPSPPVRRNVFPPTGSGGPIVQFTEGAEIGGKPHEYFRDATPARFDREAELASAAAMAKSSDVAVVCVGTDHTIEQEARDRKSLGLPGNQEELVKAVLAANPRTIVVQMSAGPLTTPWIRENVPAVLQAWWAGEEGGGALADVLFGNVNPAGRLPHTVYASEEQVPPRDEYDISKGFTYMHVKGAPLYPFGHGLSYTSFAYSDLKLSSATIKADGSVEVSVQVSNTGKTTGDEVVQLYVRDMESSVVRPVKELRGFQRVPLKPGEKREVKFTLPAAKLAFWDEKTKAFTVEPGKFEVQVGASSEDIRCREVFQVLP